MNIGETDGAIMSDVKPVAWNRYDVDSAESHANGMYVEFYDAQETVFALQAEIEALRKDAERLDYLANDMQDMTFNGVDVLDFIEEDCDWPKAWRKSLDAAIAKEKQQERLK